MKTKPKGQTKRFPSGCNNVGVIWPPQVIAFGAMGFQVDIHDTCQRCGQRSVWSWMDLDGIYETFCNYHAKVFFVKMWPWFEQSIGGGLSKALKDGIDFTKKQVAEKGEGRE